MKRSIRLLDSSVVNAKRNAAPKTRCSRFEPLEERALLAASGRETDFIEDFADANFEPALSTLDLAELNAADMSAAIALLDSIAETPSTVSYGADASCVVELDPTLASASVVAFGTEAITVDASASVSSAALETLVVTTNLDVVDANDGALSLREAIAQAETGTTITFAASMKGQTIALAGKELEITKGITVDASSLYDESTQTPGIIVDAKEASRVFYLTGGDEENPIALIGLTITGGKTSNNGGGIYVRSGSSTLTNVVVSGNTASSSSYYSYGGGIYVSGGSPTLTNVVVSGNTVSSSYYSSSCYGGGIYVDGGSPTFTDVVVSGNTASSGGGIYVNGGSSTFTNVVVSGNTASSNGGGICVYNGSSTLTNVVVSGNTASNGGGIYVNGGSSTLTDVVVSGNTASSDGGGICVYNGSSTLTNVVVSGNTASSYYSYGGGIYVYGSSTLTNVEVSGNTASYGGGIYVSDGSSTLTNVVVSGNTASSGGGIYVNDGSSTFTNVVVSGNTASSSSYYSYGGGIYVSDGSSTFTNVVVSGNTASSYSSYYSSYGGGIDVYGSSTFTNVVVSGNTASYGGGIDVSGGSPTLRNTIVALNYGSDLRQGDNAKRGVWANNLIGGDPKFVVAPIFDEEGKLTNADSLDLHLTAESVAIDRGANEFVSEVASDLDGAVRVKSAWGDAARVDLGPYEYQGSLTRAPEASLVVTTPLDVLDQMDGEISLREAIFYAETQAETGATITFAASMKGQTIALAGKELEITKGITVDASSLYDESTQTPGIIVDAKEASRVFSLWGGDEENPIALIGLTITGGNTASYYGGGIYVYGGSSTFTDVVVSGNTASSSGGGIYVNGGSPTFTNVVVSGNTASSSYYSYGGGIYVNGGSPTFTNVVVSGNTASYGGGIDVNDGSSTFTNVVVSGNTASSDGGGIYVYGDSPTFTNVEVSGNTASSDGGGIYVYGGSPTLTNVVVSGNTASYGGGIYVRSGSPTLRNTIVALNYGSDLRQGDNAKRGVWANNLIGGDPKFVVAPIFDEEGKLTNADSLDLHLTAESVAIDRGANEFVSEVASDLDGAVRVKSAWGDAARVDLGPYEYQGSLTRAPEAASLVVTTPLDVLDQMDGEISLREAIFYAEMQAETGATITFAASMKGQTIALAGQELVITEGITVDASSLYDESTQTPGIIVDAKEASRVFYLWGGDEEKPIALIGLTITGGKTSTHGGGIYVYGGSSTFTDVVVSGNTASKRGGGIYVNGGSPTFTNVEVSGNTAYSGGGIYVYGGSPTLTNVEVSGNTAYSGGGIYVNDGSSTLTNVVVSGNTASDDGGGIYDWGSSSTLTNVEVSGNTASSNGGGIYVNGSPTLTNVVVSGNTASSNGGGICVYGGSPTLTNVVVSGNTASNRGGGIYVSGGSPTLRNTIVALNYGSDLGQGDNAKRGVWANNLIGGDPKFVVAPIFDEEGKLTNADSLDLHLTAESVAIDRGANEFVSEVASDLDGAVRVKSAWGDAARVDLGPYEYQGSLTRAPEAASLVVTTPLDVLDQMDGEISLREAIFYAEMQAETGTTITFAASMKGQTIALAGQELVITEGITVDARSLYDESTQTPGIIVDAKEASRVFSLWGGDEENPIALIGLTITGGKTSNNGGGIYVYGSPTLTNVVVSGNTASSGGGIYVYGSPTLTNVVVSGNTASDDGGGIYVSGGSPTFTNVEVSGNTAKYGGGIYVNGGSPTLTNVEVSGNTASNRGGGIYVYGGSPTLTNVEVSGNTASNRGGGIYNVGTLTICNAEIVDNVAESINAGTSKYYETRAYGGGVYNSGTLTATNVTIAGNEARYSNVDGATNVGAYGGGIYNTGSKTLTLQNAIVAENQAVDGADVYNAGKTKASYTLSSYDFPDGENNYFYDAIMPLFDATSGDYRLAQFSQAVDKGNAQLALDAGLTGDSLDLIGRSRFVGKTIDLGAYESESVDNISQSGVFRGVVDFTWEQPYDEAVALRLTWISGAKSSVLGVFGASDKFAWDTTSVDDGAGRLIVENLDENDGVLQSATIAATIINDENVVVKRGTIDENETWEAGKVYLVVGWLNVASGATLTMDQGAVVKFWRNSAINAQEGAWVIVGDAATLTRAEDDAVGGDTNKDGENSVAKYGASYFKGQGNFQVSASATVKYVTTTTSGTLKNNETWLGGQVYRITGDLTVSSGVTLMILPGAILKFDAGKSLIVEKGGTLIAEGTSAAPIVFTSIKDDAFGGDTNGDEGKTSPNSGDWNKILAQGVVEMNYAHILYSGAEPDNSDDGAIFAKYGGQVVFNNGVIAHSKLVGAHCDDSSSLRMTNSVIYDAMYATHNGDYVNCVFNDLTYLANTNHFYYDGSFVNCVVANVSDKFFSGVTLRYTFQNCLFWNPKGAGPQTFAEVGKKGNIWANPLFRDAANGDYRLSAGSPCIDAGDGTLAPTTDADGTPRVTDDYSARVGTPNADGNYVDIGAYEFADGAASSLDLEPVDLKAPTSAAVGETVTLEWTTRNNGTVAATGAWNDEIYLVSASGREILVATFLRAAAIGAGDLQTSYAQVTIPKSVKAGEWTFSVRVNPNRDVFEGDATANNVRIATVKTTISVPYLVASDTFASTTELEYYKLYVPANTTYYLKYATSSPATLYLGENFLPNESKSNATSATCEYSGDVVLYETILCVPASDVEREVYVGVRANKAETLGVLTFENDAFRVFGFDRMTSDGEQVYGVVYEEYGSSGGTKLTIVGTGFFDGMSAVLKATAADVFGTSAGRFVPTVEVVSSTKAILTFADPLYAFSGKDCDYALTLNNGQTLDLKVITVGGEAVPTVNLELPDSIRLGRVYKGTIRYSNAMRDMLAPLFQVSAGSSTTFSLSEDFTDETNTLKLLGLGATAPGTLAYGESGEITFYFKSLANDSISLAVLSYEESEAIDSEYFTSWREYHKEVVAAAERLNERGQRNYNAQEAQKLAIKMKLGEPAAAISGYLEDARDAESITGATLFACWIAEDGATRVRYFETDENGWFSLDYLPANTTITLGTVDADALSQTTVTLGDSDVNGLQLTAVAKDKKMTRTVAVGTDLLAYIVYDKATLTRHKNAEATLIIQNTSDQTVDAALLTLSVVDNYGRRQALLTLDAAQAQGPMDYNMQWPDGYESSFSFLTSGVKNGVLGPGETLEIPVYWCGWFTPRSITSSAVLDDADTVATGKASASMASYSDSLSFTFELSLVEKTETHTFDSVEIQKSVRSYFEKSRYPRYFSDSQWEFVWESTTHLIGKTWGAYVTSLLDESARAAATGRESNDANALTFALFDNALDQTTMVSGMTSVVDATSSTLVFERVYYGDFSNRFRVSSMGYGWRHNWDYTLRNEDLRYNSADVYYLDMPNGKTRTFKLTQSAAKGKVFEEIGTGSGAKGELTYKTKTRSFHLADSDGSELFFDSELRLTQIVDAAGNVINLEYRYSTRYFTCRISDERGGLLTLEYDNGRVIAVGDTNGSKMTYDYDYPGYLTKATDASGCEISYRYGDFGGSLCALSEIKFGDGTKKRFLYDSVGQCVAVANTSGEPEKINRVEYLEDEAGTSVIIEYDELESIVRITDGNGAVSSFKYDNAKNQALWERVDGTALSSIYNEEGILTLTTDRAGATVSYEYAENGDITSLRYSTEENAIVYEYDERGNAVRVVDANGAVTTLAYDSCDRLTKVVYSTGRFLEYEYDALGRQISVSDGGDYYVGYAYDAQGRLAQVLDANGAAITVYAYDARGRLSREDSSNGVYTAYAYDALSRLTSKATYTVGGNVISCFAYTYNELNLVQTMTTLDGVWTYAYDALCQITASTFEPAPGSTLSNHSYEFAYDKAGNRVWSKINGREQTYTYDAMNRLLSDGVYEYAYDANGNLTSKISATEAFSYVWNQRGKILACVASTGERWDYEYDVFGALIAVTRTDAAGNVERTEYLVAPNAELSLVVASFDKDGNLIANYLYGLALVGQTDGAGTTAIYASDALGSTAALIGPNGEMLNRYVYDQHGAVLAATETVDSPFQFVGTYGVMTGVSAELIQMRARWYDPATGRFVSEDPLGYNAGDINLYRYCGNAVTVAFDPSGLIGEFKTRPASIAGLPVYNQSWTEGLMGKMIWNITAGKNFTDAIQRGDFLAGLSWYGLIDSERQGESDDDLNIQLLHEHYWDIETGYNVGYGSDGIYVEPRGYRNKYIAVSSSGYETEIIQQAVQELSKTNDWTAEKYDVFSHNCQHFADALREKYRELLDEKKDDKKKDDGDDNKKPSWQLPEQDRKKPRNPRSLDPNETRGPVGFDCVTVDANEGVEGADPFLVITTPNWTNADPSVERGFKIYFENKSTATAAAQEVFITSTLPAGYNLSSFELREVAIGNQVFDAPVGCVDGVWTVKQKSTGEEIQISVEYDPATGDVKWYLRSYVASTPDHFPTDPYAGFLPPNDKSIGNGEGYVSFVVKYEDGLTTGTKPETNATIVFDTNEPIVTNTWFNTIDADAPTAEIADIKYDEEARAIAVEWRGADVGSGVACYDAYYSVDGGETYSLWLERTTETSATILASAERYVFKIVAYDNVGHSSAGVDATFEIIGADVTRFGASEYVVEQNAALCLSATGGAPEGWTYYWDLSGSEVEVSSNFIERGAEFWTSVEELGFGVGERTIRMRPRDANGIFGPTVAATLRVVAMAPTFNVTTLSSVDSSILRLSLQATTPDDSPIARWRLDWGDGQTSEFAQLSDALTAGHYYAPTAEDAVYEVSLTALDATGAGSDVVYALTSHKVAGSGATSQTTLETVASAPNVENALTVETKEGATVAAESVCVVDSPSFDLTDVRFEALTLDAAAVWTATETAFDSASRGGYRLSLPDAVSTAERFDAAFAALEEAASTSVLDGGEFATDCGVDVWDEIEAALVGDEATRKSKRRDPFEAFAEEDAFDVWGGTAFGY